MPRHGRLDHPSTREAGSRSHGRSSGVLRVCLRFYEGQRLDVGAQAVRDYDGFPTILARFEPAIPDQFVDSTAAETAGGNCALNTEADRRDQLVLGCHVQLRLRE